MRDLASDCVPSLACACECASSLPAKVQGAGHSTLEWGEKGGELLSCSVRHSPHAAPCSHGSGVGSVLWWCWQIMDRAAVWR